MSLYLRGKIWWVSFVRNGKHIQQSTHLSDKNKAAAVESAMMLAMSPRSAIPRSAVENILFSIYGTTEPTTKTHMKNVWKEYSDAMAVRGSVICRRTSVAKQNELERFRVWAGKKNIIYLEEVDGVVAKDFALSLTSTCKAKRRHNILGDLSSIWNAITNNHQNLSNPWKSVIPKLSSADRPEKPSFTPDEENRVLASAAEHHHQWWIACMIARGTGLRFGDVHLLEWGDVDIAAGIIRTTPRKTQKSSGVIVEIPMEHSLRECLTTWYSESGNIHLPNDRVLPWIREWGGTNKNKFSNILKAAGLDPTKYSFHSWRHTFRSRLAKAGVSPELAMKLCGHTTLEMSEHYNHHDYSEEKKQAIASAFQSS